MSPKKSTTKAKKFYIAGKDEVEDPHAPVVGGEFRTADGEWQGQTVTVEAEKKFSDDTGTGEARIIRTFEFAANPETFLQYQQFNGSLPDPQIIFDSHKNGIAALLWGDGLEPSLDVEPKVIISKDKTRYLIVVGARPMSGQTLIDPTQTLTEVFNGGRTESSNQVH